MISDFDALNNVLIHELIHELKSVSMDQDSTEPHVGPSYICRVWIVPCNFHGISWDELGHWKMPEIQGKIHTVNEWWTAAMVDTGSTKILIFSSSGLKLH